MFERDFEPEMNKFLTYAPYAQLHDISKHIQHFYLNYVEKQT